MVATPTSAEWSKLLADRFFPATSSPKPVYFAVDDDVLDELLGAKHPGDGALALVRAVRPKLDTGNPDEFFEPLTKEGLAWDARGKGAIAPPFLAGIAITVLAASRMDDSDGVSVQNYYERLRQVLDISFAPDKAFRYSVAMLYRMLHDWLLRHKDQFRGISTIPKSPQPAHVGYPLSQVLFRERDRRRLTGFFREYRLKPSDSVNAAQLLGPARAWASGAGLTPGAKRLLLSRDHEPKAIALISAELASWDEAELDDRGRRVGTLRILFDPTLEQPWGLLAKKPDGWPDAAAFAPSSGSPLALVASIPGYYDPHWFASPADPLLLQALQGGLSLRGEPGSLRLASSSVWVFRPEETGGLSSHRRVTPGERHWILAAGPMADRVEAHLESWAREGWSPRSGSAPPGWRLFKDVFIDLPPTSQIDAALQPLVPAVDARPELVGGLRLQREGQGLRVLSGAEPEVWVPDWLTDRSSVAIVVDGMRLQLGARGRVDLASLNLAPGPHAVTVGAYRLDFVSVDGQQPTPVPAHSACQVVTEVPVPGEADDQGVTAIVCGSTRLDPAHDPDAGQRPLQIPYGGDKYCVIGIRPGVFATVPARQMPRWLRDADLLPKSYEIYTRSIYAWLAIHWAVRGWEVRELSGEGPGEPEGDASQLARWAGVVAEIGEPADAGERWLDFTNIAWDLLDA